MEKDIQTKREWEKRMVFHHPAEAVRHVMETKKEKKRLEELS